MAKLNTILAIDTSTNNGLVVLIKNKQIFARIQKEPREHNRHLLKMIQEVLNDAKIILNEVDVFCCGVGPGSFVGVRLGVAVIQGLSYATNKPVYALSSLALQAQAVFRLTQAQKIVMVHDARMQALYLGKYQIIDGVAKILEAEQLIRLVLDKPLAFESTFTYAGNGLNLIDHAPATSINTIPEISSDDLATLAQATIAKDQSLSPCELQPIYLQDEATWKKL